MFGIPLNGALAFVFLAALPIAFALNLIVQSLYRRAVGRIMRRSGGAPAAAFQVPAEPSSTPGTLRVETGEDLPKTPLRLALALRYLLAGLAFATVQMVLIFALDGIEFALRRSLVVIAVLALPAIPFCIHVAGLGRLHVWLGTLAFVGLLALFEQQSIVLASVYVAPAAAAALVLANRVFRTTSLTLYLIAMALIIPLIFALDLALVLVPGLQHAALPVAILLMLVAGIALAWLMARIIARVSEGASDLMLQSTAIWLITTLWQISLFSSSQGAIALLMVLSFIAHGLALYLLSRLSRPRKGPLRLFLRVFGQRKLQQRFTHGPMTDWRMKGPVILIGARDLATETLDSDELAAFLSGATDRLFITSPEDLTRVFDRNTATAHDGLYPVIDCYCQDDTWRPSVQTMMSRADSVVLDLRGFSKENQGVQFEIGELVRRVKMEALTVLVDGTTDTELARDLFTQQWNEVHQGKGPQEARLRFLSVE